MPLLLPSLLNVLILTPECMKQQLAVFVRNISAILVFILDLNVRRKQQSVEQ